MKTAKPASAASRFSGPLLLLLVLVVLFWRSFLPGIVHFSNDGPLGLQNAAWLHLPEGISGQWCDLNSIGANAGQSAPSVLTLIRWGLGSVGFAKFLAPVALWILGVGAWFFFRQSKFSPLAAVLGGLAAALNSTFFSTACWGVAAQQIALGMGFFALGLIVSNTAETPALTRWLRLALAGLCVGINVIEAADIGAIFSLFIAAFVFFRALNEEGVPALQKIGRGLLRTAVVAGFAGFIAMQTVMALIGSSITGIAGTGQDTETKAAHWDWATQWSLPKAETLAVFVPGLFGYKMDTPNNMMPAFQDAYKGGQYWGGVGRDPAIDRYFDSGRQGAPPASGFMRFIGGGTYVGILVALLAAWAIAQSFRRENSVFTANQKRMVWFWAAMLALSLPLAWGRFAPFSREADSLGFYALLYHLPYFSTIRNPVKFILVFSWIVVILFGYGVNALSRRYLDVPAGGSSSVSGQLMAWWDKVRGFDRNWTMGCAVAVVGSVLAWLVYAAQRPALVRYLQLVGFDQGAAQQIAAFSSGQVVWFIFYFAAAVLLCTLVLAGVFAGKRARLGGVLLGALLLLDLGRANLPWIIHWDYAQKYEVGSLNPIVGFLKERPYESRVAALPFRSPEQFQLFDQLYRIEWAQHLFPYYNIQSLDIIQMSRMPADLAAFEAALQARSPEDSAFLLPRRWQLTNTRYLLGPAGFLDIMNSQLDAGQQRFRVLQRFDVVPKPGIERPTKLEELTAVTSPNGAYALFEFTGALPRVKLYSRWQVSTNDEATLRILGDKNFDPLQTVLVSTPLPAAPSTNQISGLAGFKSYRPTDIVFETKSELPSVLLLNDRYDGNWRVLVDGRPAELLRCNFIMRGVYLPAGSHTVEFQFRLPDGPLKITLAAIACGVVLIGFLAWRGRRQAPFEI
ncbi:MAG: hypothetical protein WCS42_11250 [Verrucomicrobiota bacterium]